SLHTIKTPALAVGVFESGILSQAADALDQISQGVLRAIVKAEFDASPGQCLPVHNVAGITAGRVILLGLGKQEHYNAAAHARAQEALATYCARAGLGSTVSTLATIETPDATLTARARAAARHASSAVYQYTT